MAKKKLRKQYLSAFSFGMKLDARPLNETNDFSFKLLAKAKAGDEESSEILIWLALFNDEWISGLHLYPRTEKTLHQTDKLRKAVNNKRNAERRDIWQETGRANPLILENES